MESGANPVHVDDDLEDEEEYDEDYGPIPMEDDIEQDAKQYRLDDTKVKQPNNLATARFTLYKGLESMVSRLISLRYENVCFYYQHLYF